MCASSWARIASKGEPEADPRERILEIRMRGWMNLMTIGICTKPDLAIRTGRMRPARFCQGREPVCQLGADWVDAQCAQALGCDPSPKVPEVEGEDTDAPTRQHQPRNCRPRSDRTNGRTMRYRNIRCRNAGRNENKYQCTKPARQRRGFMRLALSGFCRELAGTQAVSLRERQIPLPTLVVAMVFWQ